MPTITIDGVEHELDDLSNDAKAQLNALQATDTRIAQSQQDSNPSNCESGICRCSAKGVARRRIGRS